MSAEESIFINDGFSKFRNKAEFAWRVHHEFILTHPFISGNGRCARLLLNMIRLRAGLPIEVIRYEDRVKYFQIIGTYLQRKMAANRE